MKKTQVIEVAKNIKRTSVSFISILVFVILGVGIYLGLTWTAQAFRDALGNEMNQFNVHDLKISFPYGVSEEEIKEFLDVELVDQAEGVESVYQFIEVGSETVVANVKSLTKQINILYNLEGKLPEENNEIVIERECAKRLNLSVGDKVRFFGDSVLSSYEISKIKNYTSDVDLKTYINTEEARYFKADEFTIVGIANSGEYITNNAVAYGVSPSDSLQVGCIFYVDYDAFNEDTVSGYNEVIIRNEKAGELYVFDEEYKEISNSLKENIQETTDRLAANGYRKVKDNYDQLVIDTEDKITSGKEEIVDGKAELENARKQLAEAKKKLDDAKKQLDEGSKELTEGQAQYASGLREYEAAKAKYESIKQSIDNAFELIDTVCNDTDSSLMSDLLSLGQSEDLKILLNLFDSNDIEISESDKTELETLRDRFAERTLEFIEDYAEICAVKAPGAGGTELYNDVKEIIDKVDNAEITSWEAFEKLFEDVNGENSSIIYRAVLLYSEVEGDVGTLYSGYKADLGDLADELKVIVDRIMADAKQKLDDAKAKLDAAANTIYESDKQLKEGYAEWSKGVKQYNDGLKTVEENEQLLLDAEEQLTSAEEKIKDLKEAGSSLKEVGAVILTRFEISSVYTCNMVANCINNEKYALGGLFLVIALLICYSVITRNVNNDIKLLGTKKALGFNRREVSTGYLVYTGFASIGGLVIGILLARFVVEPVIVSIASSSLFIFKVSGDYFGIKEALLMCAIQFTALEAITLYGCNDILRRSAVKLLQGPEPPKSKHRFYENWKVWEKLPLLTKTIINNCFNDPRRVFAMLVGVAGCAALVVASFVFCFDIKNEFALMSNEIYQFDSFVYYDGNANTKEEIASFLREEDVSNTPILRSDVYIASEDSEYMSAHLYVYENTDEFYDLYHLITMENKECEKGVVAIPEAVEKHFKLEVGDNIQITTLDGNIKSTEVGAFYREASAFVDVIMSKETYESVFNKEYKANTFMIITKDRDVEQLKERLAGIEGYFYTYDMKGAFQTNAKIFDGAAMAIVGVYLSVSVLMAIFVLLNLMITFVMEKKRELITLMINGFSKKQAHAYIYSDTILLTAIGILLGIGLGYGVGVLAVKMFESEYMLFNRDIGWYAVVIAIVFTSVLTYFMTKIALKQIDNFSLTDINKN